MKSLYQRYFRQYYSIIFSIEKSTSNIISPDEILLLSRSMLYRIVSYYFVRRDEKSTIPKGPKNEGQKNIDFV